jgi:hypothetical protein
MVMNNELFIRMVLDAWNQKVKELNNLFGELSDEQLEKQIAPGKNTGAYILGHLAAISNRMIPLLGLGSEVNPALYDTFVEKSEKEITYRPSVKELRKDWDDINAKLSKLFSEVTPDDWFKRHNSVSEEDFAKQPHRNKLNVIINRTNHLDYHAGQVVLLKP